MTDGYEVVVGLEVHAELNTRSKIFCGCKNAFGAEPNTLCCPVCAGMPGTLPVLNEKAVEYAVKMGLALNCRVNLISHLNRKHYFYPDLPKGYQISQYARPLCEDGYLDIGRAKQARLVGIERIHIEEDAGKLLHDGTTGETLVDYNRSGVPLIEIVTRPDLRSADEAVAAMEAIAEILLYLGISDVKMQEGSLRADVNVSVRPVGSKMYSPRCEIKNINSFSAVRRAVQAEQARQLALMRRGGQVNTETRRWDDAKGTSCVMRTKEQQQDYRFLAEPDMLAIALSEAQLARLRGEIPELPAAKARRFVETYGQTIHNAMLLCRSRYRADFYEAVVKEGASPTAAANWLLGELQALLAERGDVLKDTCLTPEGMARLLDMVTKEELSSSAAKAVLKEMLEKPGSPRQIAEEMTLLQLSDEVALTDIVQRTLAENPKAVTDYQAGKTNAFGFLVGQCIKKSAGRGNPAVLRVLLETALKS